MFIQVSIASAVSEGLPTVAIVGNLVSLGEWVPEKGLKLTATEVVSRFPRDSSNPEDVVVYSVQLEADIAASDFEFKFVKTKNTAEEGTTQSFEWEITKENRQWRQANRDVEGPTAFHFVWNDNIKTTCVRNLRPLIESDSVAPDLNTKSDDESLNGEKKVACVNIHSSGTTVASVSLDHENELDDDIAYKSSHEITSNHDRLRCSYCVKSPLHYLMTCITNR